MRDVFGISWVPDDTHAPRSFAQHEFDPFLCSCLWREGLQFGACSTSGRFGGRISPAKGDQACAWPWAAPTRDEDASWESQTLSIDETSDKDQGKSHDFVTEATAALSEEEEEEVERAFLGSVEEIRPNQGLQAVLRKFAVSRDDSPRDSSDDEGDDDSGNQSTCAGSDGPGSEDASEAGADAPPRGGGQFSTIDRSIQDILCCTAVPSCDPGLGGSLEVA